MENKINIAELLKDCPKGMELYSPIFGKVYLDKIRPHLSIVVTTDKYKEEFLYDGRYGMNGECMLFPSKGKTTWEGFHRPFKDGDILVHTQNQRLITSIYHNRVTELIIGTHCILWDKNDGLTVNAQICCYPDDTRFATEEEKEKLFQTIKENGYRWNAETKTLEKLVEPEFKVGDMIQDVDKYKVKITEVNLEDECYGYESIIAKGIGGIPFKEQDNWELVPNKFDITTLKPFDKVLVRCNSLEKWHIQFFEKYNTELGAKYPFICLCNSKYCQCIPYEGNEHLLGTTNDCDEYYKTW